MAEQKAEQKSAQDLPQPLRAAASALSRVPGAGVVSRAAGGALDKVGAVSPRGRRMAVYTGAGVLGVAGVVEWPIAVTGAAVAWLTQPRPKETAEQAVEVTAGTAASGGPAGGDSSGAPSGKASGQVPTPQVLASSGKPSAESEASPATPSDKLPAHHTGSPATPSASGGTGGSTAGRTRTGG
ncbi:hypothetical protein ACIO93_02650 [Streptomyces sp. NPDC087903]|uniref:hypothetical protein n=1 Tax=Streptomyces sp. NPDC087903 TaxID=3365819 RepID=UPI00380EB314